MITIYDLKPAFQNILRPLCQRLANWGITANQVTIAAVLLSLGMGAAIAWQPQAQSWLLELGDVVADAGLYLPFALLVNVMPILVVLVVLLAIFSEMTGLIALLLGLGISLGIWINLIFILMIGLLIVTIFNRAFHAIKEVQNV